MRPPIPVARTPAQGCGRAAGPVSGTMTHDARCNTPCACISRCWRKSPQRQAILTTIDANVRTSCVKTQYAVCRTSSVSAPPCPADAAADGPPGHVLQP